jgi:hypothetical protein
LVEKALLAQPQPPTAQSSQMSPYAESTGALLQSLHLGPAGSRKGGFTLRKGCNMPHPLHEIGLFPDDNVLIFLYKINPFLSKINAKSYSHLYVYFFILIFGKIDK